jgi:hypothetical protein
MMIYKKMAAILKECEAISKNRTNTHQGFKFRGIDDAMNTLHDTFANNGVFLLHEVLEHNVTERTTKNGGMSFHHLVKTKFHFCADDGSTVSATGIGEAADTGDKGAGKAMAYALKVCLLQTFLIPTEEDKDPDAYCHVFQQPVIAPKPQPKPAPAATPKTDKISAELAKELGTPEVITRPVFERTNPRAVSAVKEALSKAKIPNELIKENKASFEEYLQIGRDFTDYDQAVFNFFQFKGAK